jgi:tyrosine-protein kinase Etk/Wzc
MEELQDFTEDKESNFDLKAEIYKYLAYWKWLVIGIIIGGLLGFLYNRYSIPEYRTESSMLILDDKENNLSSALPSGSGSILKFSENSLDNQIVTLKSKRLVEKVIADLNHNISYFIEGNVIKSGAYKNTPIKLNFYSPDSLIHKLDTDLNVIPISKKRFKLSIEQLNYENDHEINEIIEIEGLKFSIVSNDSVQEFSSSKPIYVQINPLEEVANEYISKLEIGPKGNAKDILSLSMVQKESGKSEDFLNNLMSQFNADGVSDKRQVALSTTEFIQERLELITMELDSVELGKAEFKRKNQIMDVASGAQEFLEKSTSAEQQIFEIETQLLIIKSLKELINSNSDYQLLPVNLGVEGGMETLIESYNALVLERKSLLKNSTQDNPVIKSLDLRLDSLRKSLFDNINNGINNLKLRLTELNSLDRTSQIRFSTFPGMEKGMRGIERQQQIKEQLYLFLLQRREEAAIAFAVTSPVAKIIDPAYTFQQPVDPKPSIILIAGIVIGLLVPIIILLIIFLLDTKVHHKGDLNTLLKNTPFLGEVPKLTKDASDVIQLNDRSPLAESFRILRTNLAYLIKARAENRGEIIYITSTIKGEGKTFVSYNLARTLATSNKKVIIIGADIRNPKLHRYIDLHMETKGLSDYLYNWDIDETDIINKVSNSDIQVDFILSGTIPPNPAELFMNDRMEILVKKLSTIYDFVIVDTAPTMIVTDTLLISPLADTTLYIIRAGYTEKNMLEFPKELKKQKKLKGLAVILNDVDYSKFSYGAKYGYSYGYGYGVDNNESSWKKILNFRSKK